MDKSGTVKPSPWCQEEIWRLLHWYEVNTNRVDTPWLSTPIKLVITADGIALQSEGLDGAIELRKNVVKIGSEELWSSVIIVKTKPCVLFVGKDWIELYECAAGIDESGYKKGNWIQFDPNFAPSFDIEYVYAEEMYERLRYIFKVFVGFITDKLGF